MGILVPGLINPPAHKPSFQTGSIRHPLLVPVRGRHGSLIGANDLGCWPDFPETATVQPYRLGTEASNLVHLMAHEEDGAAGLGDALHFSQALLLELEVANGEHFI